MSSVSCHCVLATRSASGVSTSIMMVTSIPEPFTAIRTNFKEHQVTSLLPIRTEGTKNLLITRFTPMGLP